MPRDLDSQLQANATSQVFPYVVLVKLSFPSGTVYVHNGVGTHTFGGNDYLGVGAFGKIELTEETTDLLSSPIRLTLSSITAEIIAAIQNDDIYGRDADIYIGALDADYQLTGTPTNWVSGYMEKAALNIGKDDGISITIQCRAARMGLRNNKRYTKEDHQVDYAGDTFFTLLPFIQEAEVNWGGQTLGGSSGGLGTIGPSNPPLRLK